MNTLETGAQIQAPSIKPSVDLSKLSELLTDAIEADSPPSRSVDSKQRSLFLFDSKKNRLSICTSAILLRLFSQTKFRECFQDSKSSGFIRDFSVPAFGLRAKLGGELLEENKSSLPRNIDKLISAIDKALDSSLSHESELSNLLLDSPDQQLQTLAKNVRAPLPKQTFTANLQTLAFDSVTQANSQSSSAVAKVISAVEQVEGGDYSAMQQGIISRFKHQGADEDDIDDAIASLDAENESPGSQLNRFLNFLVDDALSRVRLNVTFRIMSTIAENARSSSQAANQLLVEYVNRVQALAEVARTAALPVDVTAHFGQKAEFNLSDYLNQVTFYSCLAVWPESKAQIFEEKTNHPSGHSVQREVSYRFRINGNNPERNKPAFNARLDLIEETIDQDFQNRSSARLNRRLAELIVLDAVIPKQARVYRDIPAEEIESTIQSRIAEIREQGKVAIKQLIQELRDRAKTMQAIARALINLLKLKGNKIVSQAQRQTASLFICVKRGVVDWSRLEGAEPGVRDLLVGSKNRSQEAVEWFRNIEIADSPLPQSLFSVKVMTQLTEHDLVPKNDEAQIIQAQRQFTGKLLQVIWVPYESGKEKNYKPVESAKKVRSWALSAAVQVEYEVRTLSRQRKQGTNDTQQLHAAAVAAFTVLTYCCLWRLIQRLQASIKDTAEDFTTLMLRLQESGKNSKQEGDAYVYAAAQSIEALLAQDTSVRMQGMTLDSLEPSKSARYVQRGTFTALLSAFPLTIETHCDPVLKRIGLISYATRPCDEHPTLAQGHENHLFLTQSYIASAVSQPFSGYDLRQERMQSDIVTSVEDLQRQRLVREEIEHLKTEGCQHVILISHAYGSRRLNRTNYSSSMLAPTTFLEEVFESFPDMTIYPLIRDVFPATRLQTRNRNAAFEIPGAGDHVDFHSHSSMERVRDIIPIYTFATLHVVDEERRPQSGFCVYFLITDQRVTDITWTERARLNLLNPDGESSIHPCLISVLRGLHFIEAERGEKGGQFLPVLDPFSWISPTTKEAAGEVEILHSRRRGRVHLSYPALLTHISQVLHRR